MLQKSKSKQLNSLKYLLLLPAIAVMLVYSACTEDNDSSTSLAEKEAKNFIVFRSNIVDQTILSVSARDLTKLSARELDFIREAKMGKGFRDLKLAGAETNAFQDFDEIFWVKDSNRLELLASENGISIISAGEQNKESTKTFLERESKYIDFEDAHAVPFAVIERVPTFPGCEGDNDSLKKCMAQKVSQLVNRNFNTGIGAEQGLTGVNRIFVSFLIGEDGDIYNIRARAPHPSLEEEAIRVIGTLPKMQPGEQKGKPVSVMYSLPITFKIQE